MRIILKKAEIEAERTALTCKHFQPLLQQRGCSRRTPGARVLWFIPQWERETASDRPSALWQGGINFSLTCVMAPRTDQSWESY